MHRMNVHRASRGSRGFTLVELLVVIAIIGILVALLLPAIQAAREAARRSQCKNQVKQIALGCLLHEDTHDFLPSAGWGLRWTGDPNRGYGKGQPGSWIYNILVYVEQGDLHDLASGHLPGSAAYVQADRILHSTPIPMFHCPTRRAARPYQGLWATIAPEHSTLTTLATSTGIVKTDYAANSGDSKYWDTSGGVLWEAPNYASADTNPSWSDTTCGKIGRGGVDSITCQTGISFYRSEVTLAQIADGTTNTYLVGEKYVMPEAYEGVPASSSAPGFSYGENQSMYTGYEWDNHRLAHNPGVSLPNDPEYFQPRQDTPRYDNYGAFGSAHAAGLNMAMCDGSVHFISYDINSVTHRYLANRMDGNVATPEEGQ
jgi:prepilin-type N-terminal cleavage/methylation domain-containing protein/prepilin-type processing-associated H-X9-DG protein